ncbi:MAG: malto-oligosyltrehalose synthase [Chloroflexota bacterium]
MTGARIPTATYRLQLNHTFRFTDALKLVPYLKSLGISDLYLPPIFKARAGSLHGYDIVDPCRLNPELGTAEDFENLVQHLRQQGMGLLLDIVPNHMAASPENPWWMDFLENGATSPYANFFDTTPDEKVVLPILGSPVPQAIRDGSVTLSLEESGFSIRCNDTRLPLEIKSCRLILSHSLQLLERQFGTDSPEAKALCRIIHSLQSLPLPAGQRTGKAHAQYRKRQALKRDILRLLRASPALETAARESVAFFNSDEGKVYLDELLGEQVYRLAFWRTGLREINYRRFFDVSDLVGVKVEDPTVFRRTHTLVMKLVCSGSVTGLRVDHVDGLAHPARYLTRLQRYATPEAVTASKTPPLYVVVEKILSDGEELPHSWRLFGTTGYDFLNQVNALFVDWNGLNQMDEIYRRFTGMKQDFNHTVYEKKRQVIENLFSAEMKALSSLLYQLARKDEPEAKFAAIELTEALTTVTACLPVYRTYIKTSSVNPSDRHYLEEAFKQAHQYHSALSQSALSFLENLLFLQFPLNFPGERKNAWLEFIRCWQQLTGAVMAKGFEDTTLYCFNRLISLNDVGGNPASPGLSTDKFHHWNKRRRARWPHTMNATATHDTKRGEDTRARINVLSEIPQEWEDHLARWQKQNRVQKKKVEGIHVPEPNMEIFLYQTLLGAWPLSQEELPAFRERLRAYLIKAAREAKTFTSWLEPNQSYEEALLQFAQEILADTQRNTFLEDFLNFQEKIAFFGSLNSLGQLLIKVTAPGIPDFYQGTELWDLSLVDPDNRRPVDFQKRKRYLNELMQEETLSKSRLLAQLLKSWKDGRVKLYLTQKAMRFRSENATIFQYGEYLPIQVSPNMREHIYAFGRCHEKEWALTVVSRLTTKLVSADEFPLGPVWGQSRLFLHRNAPRNWRNILTGEEIDIKEGNGLAVSEVLRTCPVALMTNI